MSDLNMPKSVHTTFIIFQFLKKISAKVVNQSNCNVHIKNSLCLYYRANDLCNLFFFQNCLSGMYRFIHKHFPT